MKRISITAFVLLMVSAALPVLALSESLPRPKLFLPKGYDAQRAEQLQAVLASQNLTYVDGMTSYWPPNWATTLVYKGDAGKLSEFIAALNRLKGITARLTFSPDLAKETGSALRTGSWWVKYVHSEPDVITVRINLADPELGKEKLALTLPKPE